MRQAAAAGRGRAAPRDPVEAALVSYLRSHPGATVDEIAHHLWEREQNGDFVLFGPEPEQARRYRLDETTRLLVRLRFPLGARRCFAARLSPRVYRWYLREQRQAARMPQKEKRAAMEYHEQLLLTTPFSMISNALAALKFLGRDIEQYRLLLHQRLDEAIDQAHHLTNG